MELRREKIPYVLIGGQSFYDRREVKDILAYLRVLDNPRDEPQLLRIINTPPRGIGQSTVKALLAQAVGQGRPLWDVLTAGHDGSETARADATKTAGETIKKFQMMIEDFRARTTTQSLAEVATQLVSHVRYQDDLRGSIPTPTSNNRVGHRYKN